ncbi:hypothetical protein Tco_0581896 [Tanacetum coccineum]
MEVSRLSGIDNDLFTYKVEVANIPCNSVMDDDLEDETDDDTGYDPSDVAFIKRGDDEVELTDEESSDDEDEIIKVDLDLLTKDIMGFETYDDYKNDWIYEWNKDDYEWYKALDDCELKEEALRNKDIMDGVINNNESCCELKRKWNIYTNYDDAYEINHEDNENKELCEIHEPPVCNIKKYMMIKYSFNDDEEYVVVKEDEYDDLIMTRRDACQAYQEIFRIMDEGWKVTRTKE